MLRRFSTAPARRMAGSAGPALSLPCVRVGASRSVVDTRKVSKKELIVAGAMGAGMTSVITIGMFHLIVVKVPLTVAAGTVGVSLVSGMLVAFEGSDLGSSFGCVMGMFFGGVGCYYAKTMQEPWRK